MSCLRCKFLFHATKYSITKCLYSVFISICVPSLLHPAPTPSSSGATPILVEDLFHKPFSVFPIQEIIFFFFKFIPMFFLFICLTECGFTIYLQFVWLQSLRTNKLSMEEKKKTVTHAKPLFKYYCLYHVYTCCYLRTHPKQITRNMPANKTSYLLV